MESKNGRSSHFVKKKSKDQKKFVPNETNPMNDEEHYEMLRVAKVDPHSHSIFSFISLSRQ